MFVTTNPLEILIFAAKKWWFLVDFSRHSLDPWRFPSPYCVPCCAMSCPATALWRTSAPARGRARPFWTTRAWWRPSPLMPRPTSSCWAKTWWTLGLFFLGCIYIYNYIITYIYILYYILYILYIIYIIYIILYIDISILIWCWAN